MAYVYDRRVQTAYANKRCFGSRSCKPRSINKLQIVKYAPKSDTPYDVHGGGVNQVPYSQVKAKSTIKNRNPFFEVDPKESYLTTRVHQMKRTKRSVNPTTIMDRISAAKHSKNLASPLVSPGGWVRKKSATTEVIFKHQAKQYKAALNDPLSSMFHAFAKQSSKHIERNEGHLNLNVDPHAFKNAHEVKGLSPALTPEAQQERTRNKLVETLTAKFVQKRNTGDPHKGGVRSRRLTSGVRSYKKRKPLLQRYKYHEPSNTM